MGYNFFQFCIALIHLNFIFSQLKLDGIGRGWDYLLDVGKLNPYKITYQNNVTTGGDKYLIPDCASSFIDSLTRYEETAEIIESGSNYTSLSSRSFDLNGGISFSKFNLSFGFSYSEEFKNMRKNLKDENSVTVRMMFLQKRYNVQINRKCPLSDYFISDILDIAKQVSENHIEMAIFLSQLLIKDYGTHALNDIIYGGIIYKNDYIKKTYWSTMQSKLDIIKKSASLTFLPFGNIGVTQSQISQVDLQQYRNNTVITGSVIAKGGIYKPSGSLNEFIDSLDNNLADIDRQGILLSDLISSDAFPSLSSSVLSQTKKYLESAILSYLTANTKVGCMDRSSDNFDFSANFHDRRACNQLNTNLQKFGGIYARERFCSNKFTCFTGTCLSSYVNDMWTKNLLNDLPSCPEGYTPNFVYSESCESWWDWHLYQCIQTSQNANFQGIYFGGIYSNRTNNPLTGKNSCPQFFTPQRLLTKRTAAYICLSINDNAKEYAVQFGGFISNYINPWTADRFNCPINFRKIFAFSLNGLEIYYCAKLTTTIDAVFEYTSLPLIERPIVFETDNTEINGSNHLMSKIILISHNLLILFFLLK
jgi:hypothetical protein